MATVLITAIMLFILMVIDVVLNARAIDADNDDSF
jgi:MFS superfamily sulfate permease-like transporter